MVRCLEEPNKCMTLLVRLSTIMVKYLEETNKYSTILIRHSVVISTRHTEQGREAPFALK